uniref:Uncharacterized protein AlNc14C513G12006 n=1 Tax=Albugo laibachii Nc14 TaxID=890382 RepID=F0X0R2_9STRA|nr:conserved hypothetical protein [Albugo laibachii Nc14]|eukprot:CCA27356.1 conserved hypothetical protein [Albugo laibachii Nc14]
MQHTSAHWSRAPKPKGKVKGPKTTKQERLEEKRLQEEAEAKRHADELIQLEEERKLKELELAKQRQLEAKNRESELLRLAIEEETSRERIELHQKRLELKLGSLKAAQDWERYLKCESRPAADIEGDVNAFLNAWSADMSTDLHHVTECCDTSCLVIDDLTFVGMEALAVDNMALVQQSFAFVDHIQRQIHTKFEFVMAHLLQFADEFTQVNSRNEVKVTSASIHHRIRIGFWINLIPKSSRNRKVDFNDLGISVDLPKSLIAQSLALQVACVPFDAFSAAPGCTSATIAMGGVFTVELLHLPPPPIRARGWTIRELSSSPQDTPVNVRMTYPLEGLVTSATLPIKISILLPSEVVISPTQSLRVGSWYSQENRWAEEGIDEITYSPETHILTFNTLQLSNLAILQQRNVNILKRQWKIRLTNSEDPSQDTPYVSLKMQTDTHDLIHIEISERGCRLKDISNLHLPSLQSDFFPPGVLLTKMTKAGVLLSPDHILSENWPNPKIKKLEDRVIKELLSIVFAYEITLGHISTNENTLKEWTQLASWSESHILFSICEIFCPYFNSMEKDHPSKAFPIHVLASVDEEVAGNGIKFTLDQCIGSEGLSSYTHLINAVDSIATLDAKERMRHPNELLEFNLLKLLSLLRIFSCSQTLP